MHLHTETHHKHCSLTHACRGFCQDAKDGSRVQGSLPCNTATHNSPPLLLTQTVIGNKCPALGKTGEVSLIFKYLHTNCVESVSVYPASKMGKFIAKSLTSTFSLCQYRFRHMFPGDFYKPLSHSEETPSALLPFVLNEQLCLITLWTRQVACPLYSPIPSHTAGFLQVSQWPHLRFGSGRIKAEAHVVYFTEHASGHVAQWFAERSPEAMQ